MPVLAEERIRAFADAPEARRQRLIEIVRARSLLRDTRVVAHALWRLLADPALPLDYAAHAAALRAELEAIASRLGGRLDIAGLVAGAGRLAGLAAGPHRDAVLIRAARALVPMDHTRGDRFVHDPALPQPAWPVLQPLRDLAASDPASDAAQMLAVAARRARNRVDAALAGLLRRERALLAGGRLRVRALPERGTEVRLDLWPSR